MAFLLMIIITFLLFILVVSVAFRPRPGKRPQYGPRKSDFKIIAGGLAVFALAWAVNAAIGG